MNNTSSRPSEISLFDLRHFPAVINGRINVVKFMEAACDLVSVIGTYSTEKLLKYYIIVIKMKLVTKCLIIFAKQCIKTVS